jgi:hypothetical protein
VRCRPVDQGAEFDGCVTFVILAAERYSGISSPDVLMIENLRKHVNTTKGLANNLGLDTRRMPFQHAG